MKKLVDVRCYVSTEQKQQIKKMAFDQNISVNKMLKDIITKAIPEPSVHLAEELEFILFRLSHSAHLTQAEREKLKIRKNEIKALLKEGGNCNE